MGVRLILMISSVIFLGLIWYGLRSQVKLGEIHTTMPHLFFLSNKYRSEQD